MYRNTPRSRKGFTLIEMLVVIAIIALLASILIPAITGALARAQRLRLSTNAGGIYKQIFAAATENTGGRTNYWAASTPNTTYANYTANSTAYFVWLMTPYDINNPANGAEVLQQDFSAFAAPEMDPVSDLTELDADANPWLVTADLNETSTSGTPFMMTKNINVTALQTWTNAQTPITTGEIPEDQTPSDNPPYGREALIVVRVGGGSEVLNEKQMFWDILNPTNADNPVLQDQ